MLHIDNIRQEKYNHRDDRQILTQKDLKRDRVKIEWERIKRQRKRREMIENMKDGTLCKQLSRDNACRDFMQEKCMIRNNRGDRQILTQKDVKRKTKIE